MLVEKVAPDCLSLQDFPPGDTSNIWRISSVTWHMGNAQKTSVNHPNEKEKSSYRKKRVPVAD